MGQVQCVLRVLQCLIRIAQTPEIPAGKAQAIHPRINPIEKGMRAVFLDVVERNPLLKMPSALPQFSQPKQACSQRLMRFEQERRVLAVLGQTHHLLGQFMRFLRVWAHQVKPPQSEQRGEEVSSFPHLPAQL